MTNRRMPFSLLLVALAASLTWSACGGSGSPTCQPVAELCNGKDDDCDGQVDEGFDVGAACSAGVGACARTGVKNCSASGATTECSAVAGSPAAESCNQLDDNCDGATDEGLAGCCVPATTRACGVDMGACRAGIETCSGSGAWGSCQLAGVPVTLPGTVAESCNGVDDDCDGATDEPDATGCTSYYADQDADGFGAGAGACLCAPGGAFTATTATDCDDTNAAVHPGAAEKCNGLDDVCNGTTDEGFGVGTTCAAGTGACERSGLTVCTASGAGVACNATPGDPVAELCNGIDDNCDGRTDEGLTAPGCALQTGVCVGSKQACGGAGGWLACTAASYPSSYQAVETTCDGLDNDCDGQTDEGPVGGGSCSAGIGACQRAGTFACVAGAVACNAIPGAPSVETCNGLDDDCNGTTDEGLTAPACDLQLGTCAGSRKLCGGAAGWLACSAANYGANYQATETACDGRDNDCDGMVDEGLAGPLCPNQNGVCSGATMSCGGVGGWLACTAANYGPAYQPGTETRCNDLDDDCDGSTDEGCDMDRDGVCTTAMTVVGTPAVCPAGGGDCDDTNAAVRPGVTEVCNGRDDNCNGAVDEPNATGCIVYYQDQDRDGYGNSGASACLCAPNATYSVLARGDCNDLNAAISPGAIESCDGLDNDCDGSTDEGLTAPFCPNQTGVCAGSRQVCGGGAGWLTCTAASYGPSYEAVEASCDGLDNDCDGSTDEGLSAPRCPNQMGVCIGSSRTCGGAAGWLACSAADFGPYYQAPETTCDSRDNDCDGSTDEGFVLGAGCTVGVGTCARSGFSVCKADGTGIQCSAVAGAPSPELCNGLDDDCDGATDENFPALGTSCDGPDADLCASGTFACRADGSGVTCNETGPGFVELCGNGIDDDCDGQTDEAGCI